MEGERSDNFYEILGVSSQASYSEIKKKYQQLVRQVQQEIIDEFFKGQ